MKKYMIGYCYRCRRDTRHEVIECKDSVGWRVFETVVTAGFALAMPHDYQCECTRCGTISTLSK